MTIDKQIVWAKALIGCNSGIAPSVLASLQRLKAIDAVQVPEEPGFLPTMRKLASKNMSGSEDVILIRYIDTLRDLLRRESARADEETAIVSKIWKMLGNPSYVELDGRSIYDLIAVLQKRAETTERQLTAMLKLGENPSEEMIRAGIAEFNLPVPPYRGIFRVMFAKLVEQAGVKK